MATLLRAELLRIRMSRRAKALLAATLLATLAIVVARLVGDDAGDLANARGVRRVLTVGGGVACLFALALGIVGMAGEYRHATIGRALLAAPARWPVLVAKALAYALAGLLLGVAALAVTFAAGVPGLANAEADVSYTSALVRYVIVGTPLAAALFAAIGVGLGALLRDQRLALAAGLGWVLLVDRLALEVVPEVGRFLPTGTVASLLRTSTDDVLPAVAGGLLLLGYALAFCVAGALALRRRDLT